MRVLQVLVNSPAAAWLANTEPSITIDDPPDPRTAWEVIGPERFNRPHISLCSRVQTSIC